MTPAESGSALPNDSSDWRRRAPPAEFLARQAPEIACEDVPNCPVCRHDRQHTLAVGFDYELLTCRNPWRFARCERCGHAWLNPRPALSALPIIYPSSYYAYNYESAIHPLAQKGKALMDRLKLRGIRKSLPGSPRNYLDIGCGSGRFLKAMERQGLARDRLYGLELDRSVVDGLSAEGYQVSCERVEHCARVATEPLDLVTMFHVIEHLDDPAAVVRKIGDWLSPGGVLALETPNLESLDARWFRDGRWGGYHIPRHWHVFTPASMAMVLRDAGLEVIETQYQTGHSFWMYSLHHQLRFGTRPHPDAAQLFDPFQGFLPFLVMFTAFDKLRAALHYQTSSMLVLARKPI